MVPANPEFGYFTEIRPSLAPAKFLAVFAGCQTARAVAAHSFNYDKASAADLSQLSSVIPGWRNAKFIAVPQTSKQWCNKGSTELYCLFIAADSIVDAISFIRHIVLWPQNKFSPNPALVGFEFSEFLNPARSGTGWIWKSQIRYNPKYHPLEVLCSETKVLSFCQHSSSCAKFTKDYTSSPVWTSFAETGIEPNSNWTNQTRTHILGELNQARTGQLATDVELEQNQTHTHEKSEPNNNCAVWFLKGSRNWS